MPTRNEAFGLVYQEAGAAGLPVIGSRLNAVPEIVGPGTGFLIDRGDRRALVEAMQRTLDSASLRRTLGTAARRQVEREADPIAHRDRLLSIIHDVAGRAHV